MEVDDVEVSRSRWVGGRELVWGEIALSWVMTGWGVIMIDVEMAL